MRILSHMKGLYVCLVCRTFLSSLSSIINALFALSPLKFNSFRWCLWLCPILMGQEVPFEIWELQGKKNTSIQEWYKVKNGRVLSLCLMACLGYHPWKIDCSNQCSICFLIRLFPLFFIYFLKMFTLSVIWP